MCYFHNLFSLKDISLKLFNLRKNYSRSCRSRSILSLTEWSVFGLYPLQKINHENNTHENLIFTLRYLGSIFLPLTTRKYKTNFVKSHRDIDPSTMLYFIDIPTSHNTHVIQIELKKKLRVFIRDLNIFHIYLR